MCTDSVDLSSKLLYKLLLTSLLLVKLLLLKLGFFFQLFGYLSGVSSLRTFKVSFLIELSLLFKQDKQPDIKMKD